MSNLVGEQECIICMAEPPTMISQCQHKIMCLECAKLHLSTFAKFSIQCPICRAKIDYLQKGVDGEILFSPSSLMVRMLKMRLEMTENTEQSTKDTYFELTSSLVNSNAEMIMEMTGLWNIFALPGAIGDLSTMKTKLAARQLLEIDEHRKFNQFMYTGYYLYKRTHP